MSNKKIAKLASRIALTTVATIGLAPTAYAGSLTPASFNAEIDINESVSVDRTVTLDVQPVSKLDVLFLADNTGSMSEAIADVIANAQQLLQQLNEDYNDVEFGVAKYLGDPVEGVADTTAYQLLEPVNGGTVGNSVAAINQWNASGGADWREANFYALHQAATSGGTTDSGHSSGYNTQWRSDAKKIIVWFGDAYSHTDTVDRAETIQALQDNDITVLALNVDSTIWSANWGINRNTQAQEIVTATGGIFADNVATSEVASTIQSLIDNSNSTLDLDFTTRGDTSGLNINFTCTDTRGCSDVPGGESRTFRMDVMGIIPGSYNFNTVVVGVDGAIGTDTVTVRGYAD